MQGKRGLVMGVANNHSIAWGFQALAAQGAELAFTYQGDALGKRVKPLAAEVSSDFVLACDVEDVASVDAVVDAIKERWGKLDFIVHAIGFSDKNELKGLYADTTRENFSRTMVISCFSFTEIAKRCAPLMEDGGAMLTLTYNGSTRVIPNYNVMGLPRQRWRLRCAISLPTTVRVASASMPFPPARSARLPAPASRMRARSSPGTSAMRRCARL